MRHRTVWAATAAIVATALLVSCSSASDNTSELRTVRDETGQVQVPAEPARVFGMYTSDLDMAITLGLPLAPVQSIRAGSVSFPDFLPADALDGVQTLVNYPEFDFEAIASAAPDVILNGLGYEGGPDAERLTQIAPTFTYDGFSGDWLEKFELVAEAFDRTAQYQQYVDTLDARFADLRALLDGGEKPTVLYGWANTEGGAGFYGPDAGGSPFVDALGKVGLSTTAAATEPWTELAQENLNQLADVDILIFAVETSADVEELVRRVNSDPVWAALPAVRDGQVYTVSNELSYASPYAELAFLDEFERILTEWKNR